MQVSHPFLQFGNCRVVLLNQCALFVFLAVHFVGRDDDGGGYLVVFFQVEQADALGGAAGSANGLGVDADDLTPLADDYQLRGFVDASPRPRR